MTTLKQEAEGDIWARPGKPIAEILLHHNNIYVETLDGERWRITFGDPQVQMIAERIR